MASWTPEPAKLQEILQTMCDSINEGQKAIVRKLKRFTRVPDDIAYLAHILAALPQEEDQIRAAAGHFLKDNASLVLKASPDVAQYAKAAILSAFKDPSALVRTAAGQVIVVFLKALEPGNWANCLEQLLCMLGDRNYQETALSVFERACEDFPGKLDAETSGTRPLKHMISKFLKLSEHPSPKMRSYAVACLSYFVPIKSRSLLTHIDTFVACLFMHTSDEDPSVRRHVCKSFKLLLAAWPEKFVPELPNIAEYMLHTLKDKDESVATEACRFWLIIAENPGLAPYLHPLLGHVAPALLDSMVYSEDNLQLEGNNSNVFSDKPSMEWNLRNSASVTLDIWAVTFGGDLMNAVLAPLQDKLQSTEWLQRESAILALGAIAKGCFDHIKEDLNVLIPYLHDALDDDSPFVRSITCWSLGRYACWCTQPASEDHRNRFFAPTMEGLLRQLLDDNKRVQEAACSAFADLSMEENAGTMLCPYLEPVLRNFVLASQKYQHRNMLILYDAIGGLARAVGHELSNPQYVEILMPPLSSQWNILQDDDKDLIHLLECLSSVAPAVGTSFALYIPLAFQRCVKIVQQSVLKSQAYQQNPDLDEPDKSTLVASLNLLSGLVQSLGMSLEPTISSTKQHADIFVLLASCWMHPQSSVRQSAYTLVGHLAIGYFTLLRPYLPALMPALILQLDPKPKEEALGAQSKLAWAIGEIALRYKRGDPEFQHWVKPLIDHLILILLHPLVPREVYENVAVSIGQISLVHPVLVAPRLLDFAEIWCEIFCGVREKAETDSAFRGFCMLVKTNPTGIILSLISFCIAVVQWSNPSPELDKMFREVLTGIRDRTPGVWRALIPALSPAVLENLTVRYGLL
ncbi:armadillo-type protein [Chiua virens]|nr:armadillo-type protein [Chiua virens]